MRLLLLSLLVAAGARAQAPADSTVAPDPRVQAVLAELGYTFDVDDDGIFRLTFVLGDMDDPASRTQLVFIRSVTDGVGGLEVREVYSLAASPPADGVLDEALVRRLLDENPTFRFGAWGTEDGYVLFTAALDADAPASVLDDALAMVYTTADQLESELSGDDEW